MRTPLRVGPATALSLPGHPWGRETPLGLGDTLVVGVGVLRAAPSVRGDTHRVEGHPRSWGQPAEASAAGPASPQNLVSLPTSETDGSTTCKANAKDPERHPEGGQGPAAALTLRPVSPRLRKCPPLRPPHTPTAGAPAPPMPGGCPALHAVIGRTGPGRAPIGLRACPLLGRAPPPRQRIPARPRGRPRPPSAQRPVRPRTRGRGH